jgi:hypothetical protein
MISRRSFLASTFCCGAGALLYGCGGSGGTGSGSGGSDEQELNACSSDAYLPNYAPSIGSLYYWEQLPLSVAITTETRAGSVVIEDLVREGFGKWSDGTFGSADWREVNQAQNPMATCKVEVLDSRPRILGSTKLYFVRNQTALSSAEIVVNAWPNMSAFELDRVVNTAAHEIGHAFGIAGHSNSDTDLMYIYGNGTDQPTTRDINTLRTAYCGFTRAPQSIPGRSPDEEGILIRCPGAA